MLEHADHFDMYGTSTSLLTDGVYASFNDVTIVADPDGLSTQRCIRCDQDGNSSLRYVLSDEMPILGIAQRVFLSNLPLNVSQQVIPMSWRGSDNRYIFHILVETTGRISCYTWTSGAFQTPTLVATTDTPVISAEGWYHLEAKLTNSTGPATADGEFELRVEGVPVLEATGFNNWSADTYQITFETNDDGLGAGPAMYVKDYVVWNDEGIHNNDFLGEVLVINCVPETPDVDQGDWTPSTGTDLWPILDNNPPNDSQYIEAGPTDTDAFVLTMTNLPPEITTVKGVFTYLRSRKIDGGDAQQQVSMVSGSDESPGTDRPISSAYIYWKDLHETDPATDDPWTRAGVDASLFKGDRTL